MPELTGDEHKAAELFIDIQWKVISQLVDALARGFGLYVLILGGSLTFLSGLGKSPASSQKIVFFDMRGFDGLICGIKRSSDGTYSFRAGIQILQ
jgi:hypothetical protein